MAIDHLNQAVKDKPFSYAYYNLGRSYQAEKEFEKALQNFDKVVDLDPQDAETYYNRGYVKFRLGRYEQAIEDYNFTGTVDYTNEFQFGEITVSLEFIEVSTNEMLVHRST